MAIGGIGSTNYYNSGINSSFLNYQSSLNDIKLQNALKKVGASSGSSSNSKTSTVSSGTTDYIKKYNSAMSDLLKSSNTLKESNSAGALNQLSVSSSDNEILSAKGNYKSTNAQQFEISVSQLASAQQNVSQQFNSTDKATGDINMSIATNLGNIDVNVSAQKTDGTQKNMKEMLQDTANNINLQNSGLTASVVTKDGKSSLQITSKKTGEDGAFVVSGDFANTSGLDTASKAAQNAKYSVTGSKDGITQEYSTSTNDFSLENGKITGTLKKVGDATVNVGVDNKKVVSAVEELVKSYNSAVSLLNSNAARGTGSANQLRSMLASPASAKKMELIGITKNKDGTLSLDKDKLNEMFEKDPDLTKDIIGGQFGIAQGAYAKAQSGITKSSESLINNDLKVARQSKSNDSINFLNKFSSSGAYNTMNYYSLGMMFNYLA